MLLLPAFRYLDRFAEPAFQCGYPPTPSKCTCFTGKKTKGKRIKMNCLEAVGNAERERSEGWGRDLLALPVCVCVLRTWMGSEISAPSWRDKLPFPVPATVCQSWKLLTFQCKVRKARAASLSPHLLNSRQPTAACALLFHPPPSLHCSCLHFLTIHPPPRLHSAGHREWSICPFCSHPWRGS